MDSSTHPSTEIFLSIFNHLPDPTVDMVDNLPNVWQDHLEKTSSKVITRFPPEPNGYMHLGHAKSCHLNFGFASNKSGSCILRFDDTNPEAEEQSYIDSIIESVKWLGHTPSQITYSSDYFPKLYNFAIQLIKQGDAYICHLSGPEIRAFRAARKPSPFRDRPISENLSLFEDMKNGKISEGQAVLRMKMDYMSNNPNMHDLVAYRVKFTPHPHAGSDWCIYPSYDFTHCICDSLEHISHSMCTLEFETRREPYYWLLTKLGIYKAYEFEMSRLNLGHTVMSKRKMVAMVSERLVRGWDDPRLPTIMGLKRRGITPSMITAFCNTIAVSRADNLIGEHLLHECVRAELDPIAPRTLGILNPLKVIITNLEKPVECDYPIHPKNESMGQRTMLFDSPIYIDHDDFRLQDKKKYFGLAPGKTVHLRRAFNITIDKFDLDDNGVPVCLYATVDLTNEFKSKGHLSWVPSTAPKCEFRLYEGLFTPEDCRKLGSDWRNQLNPNSEQICYGRIDPWIKTLAKPFQIERVGFFVHDTDSSPENLVFNRIIPNKANKKKKAGI